MELKKTNSVIVGQLTYDEIWEGAQMPEPDQVAWPDGARYETFGGMAANAAVVYQALGAASLRLVSAVGRDNEAQKVRQWLHNSDVSTKFIIEYPENRTAKAFIWVDTQSGSRQVYFDEGALAILTMQSVITSGALAQADGLHVGGLGVLSGLEQHVGELFEYAKQSCSKIITSFDTCVPVFGRETVDLVELLKVTDLALTSLREAELYTGQRTAENIADWLLSHEAGVAMVTQAQEGLLVRGQHDRESLMLEAISPKDAFLHGEIPSSLESTEKTGCGDAARAAFLWIYHKTRNHQLAAMAANIVGARTTSGPGGTVGKLSWSHLNELGQKIYAARWTEQI